MFTPILPYSINAFLAILIFASVHLWASNLREKNIFHGKFLSIGGGIAIAYVFIDLMPKLCEADLIVKEALSGIFPYFERHVYILALCGFISFFLVDRSQNLQSRSSGLFLSLVSYSLFNFLVGYAVTYKDDPDIQPLALFTVAIALHYFTNDYALSKEHGLWYDLYGKWILIASLLIGWLTGNLVVISAPAIALVNAFIAGGVIMNVTRHELPAENPHSTAAFLFGTLLYTAVLLSIGE